jgi:homocysteine S-methyltransferase
MINCAHPTHFPSAGADAPWLDRVKGIRANASRLSHAELDAATELDRGDPGELAELYGSLRSALDLRVVGGCCGTDHEHIAAIADAMVANLGLPAPRHAGSAIDHTVGRSGR